MEIENKKNNTNNNDFIIKSKQGLIKKFLTIIFTFLMWIYSIGVFYFFINAMFNRNNKYFGVIREYFKMTNKDINKYLIIVGSFLIVVFLNIDIWRVYNKKRFGKLNRRVYPKDTTYEEMLNLNLITEENFEKLQKNTKFLVFEENPIKEL